jgi:hypothetical protein
MTNLDIQNSRYLLKRLNKKTNFLSSLMTQEDFVVSDFEKIWTALYLILLIRNWRKSVEKVLKKVVLSKKYNKMREFLKKNNGGRNVKYY